MGCGISNVQNGNQIPTNDLNNPSLHLRTSPKKHVLKGDEVLATELATPLQKVRAYEAIKKNDSYLLTKALAELKPTENLETTGANFTFLHAAARHNSSQSMEVIVLWLQSNDPDSIESIFSIKDCNGHTPAALCVVNKAAATLSVLIVASLIDYETKDQNGLTIKDLARQHSPDCLRLLERGYSGDLVTQKTQNVLDRSLASMNDDIFEKTMKNKVATLNKLERIKTMKMDRGKTLNKLKWDKSPNKPAPQNFTWARLEERLPGNSLQDSDAMFEDIPANSIVYRVLKELYGSDQNFSDEEFLPEVASITKNESHTHYKHFTGAKWIRPHELFGCDYDNIHVFDNINPSDIAQGILGVCYLLSSLSALAEFPSRLMSIFITPNVNKYGAYALRLYIKGIPREIVVDDLIPCFGDRKPQPLFSKPKGNELWVLLAEKAWAKVYKSYSAAESGFMDEALEYLLGTPSYRYKCNDQSSEEIFEIINHSDQENYAMCGATLGTVTKEQGLIASHAYSIISAYDLGDYKILKLRNPWGKFEWTGDFCDNSSLWTEERKVKANYTNEDDGVFCMTVQDFKKYFDFYSISVYNEGWQYSYIEAESTCNHAEYFKINIKEPCEVYFRVHQDDKRHHPNGEEKYACGDLIVSKVEADGTYSPVLNNHADFYIGSLSGARSIFPTKDRKLVIKEAGEYVLRVKMRWRNSGTNKFTLSAYSPIRLIFRHVNTIKDFLPKFLKNSVENGKKVDMGDGCSVTYEFYSHYLYLYFDNQTDKKWDMIVRFSQMLNLKIAKPFRTSDGAMGLIIPPKSQEVAYLKKVDLVTGASYAWEFEDAFV